MNVTSLLPNVANKNFSSHNRATTRFLVWNPLGLPQNLSVGRKSSQRLGRPSGRTIDGSRPRPQLSRPRGRCPCQELQSASPRWPSWPSGRRLAACSSSSSTARRPRPRQPPAARNHSPAVRSTRRRQRSGPHRRSGVIHPQLRGRGGVHQAAGELPDDAGRDHLERRLDDRHHAGPDAATEVPTSPTAGSPDRHGLHVPHQAGLRLEHHAGPPGHLPGLPARVQGVLQPGQPGRQPGLLHQHDQGAGGVRRRGDAYFANAKTHAPTAANIKAFQNSHNIAGISTRTRRRSSHPVGPGQLIHLHAGDAVRVGPAGRVRHLRAELDPARRSTISDGPYQISSYVSGKSITSSATRPGSSRPTRWHDYRTIRREPRRHLGPDSAGRHRPARRT